MSDESKIGAPWSDHELDVIVGDYFNMLSDDLAGTPYVKAKHNASVMSATGRTASVSRIQASEHFCRPG